MICYVILHMLSYKTHLLCYIAHDMLFYITDMLCYITDDVRLCNTRYVMLYNT